MHATIPLEGLGTTLTKDSRLGRCGKRCLMSALGHKQTFAAQNAMSALPPIATSIAFSACLLWAKTDRFFDYRSPHLLEACRFQPPARSLLRKLPAMSS